MIEKIILLIVIVILLAIIFKLCNIFDDDRVMVRAFDGKFYRVRNIRNKEETADALARLNTKVETLLSKLIKENDIEFKPAIFRLKNRYKSEILSEGRIDRRYTSYTVNKGEQVVLCLRTRDFKDEIYDDNLIFYVTLHELAHIASLREDPNHITPEFWSNFRYLLKKASEYEMFNKITENFHYCGMDVNGM